MIRQLFDRIKKAFRGDREVRPANAQTKARVNATLMASTLAQSHRRKSSRVKSGAGRLFRSYKPAKPANM